MNEKEFLESLKLNEEYSAYELKQLINAGKKELMPQKINVFSKFINMFRKKKTYIDIINDNFPTILESFQGVNWNRGLELLIDIPEVHSKINENIVYILKNSKSYSNTFLLQYIDKVSNSKQLIQDTLKEILESNPEKILSNAQIIKQQLGKENIEGMNEILQAHKLDISKEMLNNIALKDYNKAFPSQEDFEDYSQTLSMVIDEILENENLEYSDIESMTPGGFSDVYSIGDKVLKVGCPRRKYEIPNHRRILQPLLRTNFTTKYDNVDFACVEVTEKVEMFNGTDEELYEVYKELRESGIVFTDFKRNNFGILKKDNIAHWKNGLNVEPNAAGLVGNQDWEPLKAGEIVIIDSDFLYRDDDPNIEHVNEPQEKIAREKYEQEIKKEDTDYMKTLKSQVVPPQDIDEKQEMQEVIQKEHIDKESDEKGI